MRSWRSIGPGCSRMRFFADLFASGRGRPSMPGEVVASVMVLQASGGFV